MSVHDAAVTQRDLPISLRRERGIVRDQQQRAAALAIEAQQEIDDRGAGDRVEVPGGLIGEENTGRPRDGPRERHALLLAAGELHGIVMAARGKPDLVEQRFGPCARIGRARELERHGDVLDRGERLDQVIRLEHEADPVPAEAREGIFIQRAQIDAVHHDGATRRRVETGDEAEQRGLAAPRRAHDRDALASRDVEAHAIEHGDTPAATRQAHDDVADVNHPGTHTTLGSTMAWLATLLLLTLAAPVAAADRVVAILGDSLTAGLGVSADEAYPARLEEKLKREGYGYRVVNAGVSGDTSSGGLRRVDFVLRLHPDVVIVALGANDGLRGQPVAQLRDNLVAIVQKARAAGARVLLTGMRVPTNYGAEYTRDFAAVFPEVARRTNVPLVPFLLEGVAADARYNQGDGIHPNAEGQRVIAEHVWPHLKPLLVKSGVMTAPPAPRSVRATVPPPLARIFSGTDHPRRSLPFS